MKFYRIIQSISLYIVLFLIPVLQDQINDYSNAEDDYMRKQTYYVVEHLYYDVKNLVCKQLGQEATSHDCKKGIFQDVRLESALKNELDTKNKKSRSLNIFWMIYYFFAILSLFGTIIEYRKEYLKEA